MCPIENNIYCLIKTNTYGLICISAAQASSSVIDGVFRIHRNTRLTSVTSTTLTSSRTDCVVKCMRTIGCLAVSITTDNDVVSCGLATGVTDVLDDANSNIYILGKSMTISIHFCVHDI